ncbi:MAG TPA: M23 family metallopeptidase [Rectinemataceae bacterium]
MGFIPALGRGLVDAWSKGRERIWGAAESPEAGQDGGISLPRRHGAIALATALARRGWQEAARFPRTRILKAGIVFLAGIATISVGASVILAASRFPIANSALFLPDEDSAQKALLAYLDPHQGMDESPAPGSLPPIPISIKLSTYSVRSGDSLDKIAKRFGLRQDTIISANSLQKASSLRSGLQLRIPNMDGISHKVRKGESLSAISRSYGVEVTRIVDANDLASGTITAGQTLFIPNARLSSATLREFYGERFVWPARGRISSPYGYRANPFTGLRTFHSAIDIVMSPGTKVKATSDGTVADTGYNSVFGNYVILRHSSGYQSLYAHLSSIGVHEGAAVSQGSVVGLSGNTGQSTGPHLHFSLFKSGQALDPLKYIR